MMGDKKSSNRAANMMLSSGEGVPVQFAIIITNVFSACSFQVKGKDPNTGHSRVLPYELGSRDHTAYQDFFEKLARDFGLRLPRNRQETVMRTFDVTYREVLIKNLAPGMLYGYGDPAVIKVEDDKAGGDASYYLLSTSNDAPDSFPIIRSKDLVSWEFAGYVFPRGQKPEWAKEGEGSDYWAAEMHLVQNEFRVYFVARDKQTGELCIGLARSALPCGPFVADPLPIMKGNRIDPHVFVAEDGSAWLYWKEDNNDIWPALLVDFLYENPGFITVLFPQVEDQVTASFIVTLWPWARMLDPMERFQAIQVFIESVIGGYAGFSKKLQALLGNIPQRMQEQVNSVLHHMETPIFAQQLSTDGSGLVGEQARILKNDLAWEAHLVEGMWVTKQSGRFYLFYTGNDFSTNEYGIGVAVAESPLGPYRKMALPLLQSTESWWAPGHPSLVNDPSGRPQLFLHAYFPGKAGYKQFRALLAISVAFTEHAVVIEPAFSP
jgi:hypothetical protein